MAQKFTVPVTIKNLSSAGSDGLAVFLDQESFARLKVEAGGRITWGPGSGAGDTNLYRDAESVLKTDDTFKAAGLYVSGTQIDTSGATNGDALVFNGTKFVSASVAGGGGNASLTVSDTPPTGASVGDLWFESDTGKTFVYYDSFWVEVGESGGYVLAESISGNAATATKLATARTISLIGDVSGSASFDGSSSVSISTSVQPNSIALGTDTTGNYMSGVSAGTGIAVSHTPGEGSTATISIESTAWTAYTPTITADAGGFALNNGTLTGRYKQVGKTVFFKLKFVFGSTTSPGTGHWNFSLPVTAYDSNFTFSATILDDTVAWYGGIGNGNYTGSTSSFAVIIPGTNASVTTWAVVGNGGPFIWTTNDNITISGSYEAA